MNHGSLFFRLLSGISIAPLLVGCVSLTPFDEVQRAHPEQRWVDVDGRRVAVDQVGEGTPVILLHGFGASSWSWRNVADRLASDHLVIVPDLAGFGLSERPRDLDAYTLRAQADGVLALADSLGLERFHLVGHSYGGGIASWLAVNNAQRLRSLSLVSSTLPRYGHDRRRGWAGVPPLVSMILRGAALRPWVVRRGLERMVADPEIVSEEMVQAYLERLRIEGQIRAYRGLTRPLKEESLEIDPRSIEIPTLVVWGELDEVLPLEETRPVIDLLPSAELVVLPQVGHLAMEEAAEPLAEVLSAFLSQRDAADLQLGS